MSSARRLGNVCVTCCGLLALGCGAGAKGETGLSTARQAVTGGSPFEVTTNPIISYDRAHYSSDPSVIVLDGFRRNSEAYPEPLLALLTSTDLVDLPPESFPMDGTHLYSTFGDGNGVFEDDNLKTTWFEYGDGKRPEPVVQESDFDNWTLQGSNALFAPDIQFVPSTSEGQNSLFIYDPDVDQGDIKRIGVAEAKSPGGDILFDQFVAKNDAPNDYFKILPGDPLLGNNGLPPNNGYAFDPGVFFASDTVTVPPDTQPTLHEGFFMAYADGILSNDNGLIGKNLSLVQINAPDMTQGTYRGKIGFSNASNYGALNAYMEGPDVHVMSTPSGSKHYYLVFAAQVEPLPTDTSYIGYATCMPQEFWRAPTNCWKFKGWLFRNHHTGRNNQVSLVQFNEHYYVFFHRVRPLLNTTTAQGISRSREVCAKEIELIDNGGQDDDGEIRGVKAPANPSATRDFTTLDGLTRGMTRGIIQFRDESMPDTVVINRMNVEATANNVTTNPATIRLASLRTSASSFRLHYYVDIEPGSNLVPQLTQPTDPNLKLGTPPLKHIGGRTWAVVLEYVPTAPVGPSIGGLLTLRYDVATSPFVRSNDFSQPVGNYYTWTSRVALMSTNDELLAGEVPEIVVPRRFKTSAPDADGRFTYLTVANNDENTGINNQYLKTGTAAEQATQQWIVESASNFPYLEDADKAKAFRLRSLSANFYMTSNDVTNIDGSRQPFFFLLSQSMRPNWNSQVWVMDQAGETANQFRIRSTFLPYDSASPPNFGQPEFLTRDTARNGNRGLQDVFVEPNVPTNTTNPLQRWVMEDVPQSHYLRTFAADADSKFTYLALTATSENAGINNQYLNTGLTGEEWVMEPATDFTDFANLPPADQPRAFRFRNVQTGFYMTSNDDSTRQPHFWLLDQALHKDWNTQVWIVETPGTGPTRLRCVFNPDGQPLFLTRNINNPSSNRGTQSVYVQPSDVTNVDRQKWFIE